MKLPSKSQWRQFFKVLTKKEKNIFLIFLFFFLSSSIFLLINFYFQNTEVKAAIGGKYIEGILAENGGPRYINPIYAETSDVNRDLVEMIFSGLMKYSPDGKIIPDLVKEDYKVLEEGIIYEFSLKENLFWHDSKPLTADDVIFTIEAIQNPEINSPLRVNWLGVEVEKISDSSFRFTLKNPSAVFLENCTVKIIPKHIWQDISSQNFPLATYNLAPVGSGPYKFKKIFQGKEGNIESLDLERNSEYFGKKPNISQISFQFFNNKEQLIAAANLGKINGFSIRPSKDISFKNNQFQQYSLSLPRYFAIFLNPQKLKLFSEEKIRQALNYGIDKEEIVQEVLGGRGEIIDSPILPEIYGFEKPLEIYDFNPEKAKELLNKAGFTKFNQEGILVKTVKEEPSFQFKSDLKIGSEGNEVKKLQECLARDPEIYPEGEVTSYFGSKTKAAVIRFQEKYKEDVLSPYNLTKGTGEVKTSTRAKLNEIYFQSSEETIPLKFSLTTVDQPLLIEMASMVKSQLEKLGIETEIKTFDSFTLEREIIKPRDYEALLFGEVLGAIPDPFPFWSSLQKKDPGLNLSIYENKECDKLLEEARQSLDDEIRKEKLEEFQNILIEDAPVVFLVNPDYLYFVSKKIKGIDTKLISDPSKRFSGIENWYIKTKRAWK